MIPDVLLLLRRLPRVLRSGLTQKRNALFLLGLVLAVFTVGSAARASFSMAALFGYLALSALSHGAHERSGRGCSVEIRPGDASAVMDALVLICGYSSMSPAFREPRDLPADFLALFRRVIVVRLEGGAGWPAEKIDRLARELEEQLICLRSNRRSVVVAHSRGVQLMAACRLFASDRWYKVAMHPPAGVHRAFRWLLPRSSEVEETDQLGRKLARVVRAGGRVPWDRAYQSMFVDSMVVRFDPHPTIVNVAPIGSHVVSFASAKSAAWSDLIAVIDRATTAGPDRRPL